MARAATTKTATKPRKTSAARAKALKKQESEVIVAVSHSEALLVTTTLSGHPVPVAALSDEQLAIANFVRNGRGNLVVQARAGTGKTYLLRRCVPMMFGKIAIAAYNKKIAREIKSKLAEDGTALREWADVQADRDGIDVGTFHSYGYRVLRGALRGVRIEGGGRDGAGFYKFDVICERLRIAKPIQSLVRRAIERAQERLLELPKQGQAAVPAMQDAQRAMVVNFLYGLVEHEPPQWRAQMANIARWYERYGYLTEAQKKSASMGAKNAGQRLPKELIVGRENAPVISSPTQEIPVNNGLDPRWFDLAKHYALELDLPSDDSVEMQLLITKMGGDVSKARKALLQQCLELAARAIHESAKMARETFRAKRYVKGRGWVEAEEFIGVISYNEMLYLPIYYNLAFPKYDWVLVDEAQDSNDARREFARRMMKDRARLFAVGDESQSIYGWAGADNDAMDRIIKDFACTVFPMTMTFRCGKAIVELAKKLVPDYRAADSNPEGTVETIDEAKFAEMTLLPTDAIICRNTAPLVRTAYKLIARGIACHVEGKDIGKQLLPLLYRWPNIKNVAPYLDKLTEYRDAEVAKLMQQKMESAAEGLIDRVETIQAIIEFLPKNSAVADVQAHVEKLFSDTDDGETPNNVTLITVHRSKGLEFDRVFGWGVNKYMPSPYAKQEWQQVQERNLEYVLKTRAINHYFDVTVA
jgi:superfamily I DNA/RNA helicase